jgi:hypothetical protein
MLAKHRRIAEHNILLLPFGYYLEHDADLLTLRRSDSSFVAAFSALGLDPVEVELAVYEDAD